MNYRGLFIDLDLTCRAELKEAKKIEKEAKEENKKTETAAKNGDNKELTAEAVAKNNEAMKKNGEAKAEKPKELEKNKEEDRKEEFKSTPLYPRPTQNWSDLFFIIDTLSFNIDMCDLIIFMTKINPVPGLENKKISVDASYLDTSSNTLIVSTTEAGIIENILGRTCQTIEF